MTDVDRYELGEVLAAGGMATVHLGRVRGAVGFARVVAIKRLHSTLVDDPSFVNMFIDEARLASRIRHPNVVPTLDVITAANEILIVLEYVHGEALQTIRRVLAMNGERMPQAIAVAIVSDLLQGLHAAHETTDDSGALLGIVHRDVSPQNVIVGVDGVARVLDFGIAKAAGRIQTTGEGQVKGKFGYMAPEQFRGETDRRTDVYAASVVLWELLTGRKLFDGASPPEILASVLARKIPPPRAIDPEISGELEDVVLCGLENDPSRRFPSARDMNAALLAAAPRASALEVSEWLAPTMRDTLAAKSERVLKVERGETSGPAAVISLPPRAMVVDGKQWLLVIAAFAIAFCGAGIAAFAIRARARQSAVVQAPPVNAILVTATATATVEPFPSVTASIEPSAPKPPSMVPEVVPTVRPHRWKRTSPAAHPDATTSSAGSRSNCDPPYTIDAHDIRHFKEECL